MKKTLPGLAVLLIAGCAFPIDTNFSYPMSFGSPFEAVQWVSKNIAGIDTKGVQSPELTYKAGSGDCTDHVLLAMQFCHDMGYNPESVVVLTPQNTYHAIMHMDGVYYDCVFGFIIDPIARKYQILQIESYDKSMGSITLY